MSDRDTLVDLLAATDWYDSPEACEQAANRLAAGGVRPPADDNTITISRTEYEQLVADSNKLARLEAAGADTWAGYQ